MREKEEQAFLEALVQTFEREERMIIPSSQIKDPDSFFSCLKASDYPAMVQVGITNICDLSCNECYHKIYKKKPSYRPVFMDLEIFKKVVNEVVFFPCSTVFRFLGKGESLLHPNLIEMVSYAKNYLTQSVALITNGIKLNKKMAAQLLGTGIDVIDISIDAYSVEKYGKVRSNPEFFSIAISNVENLINLRNQGKFDTKIFVSFLIQPENYLELEDFEKYWKEKVDKILFRKYHTYGGKIGKKPTPNKSRTPCVALWNRININERGLITRCFVDWDDECILADFKNSNVTLLDTWKSKIFESVRKEHLEGKYSEICEKCEGWQTAHWTISYEKAIEITGGRK